MKKTILLLSLFSLFSHCITVAIDDYSKWAPADFNPKKVVLLVEESPRNINDKEMKATLNKYYPYKYIFVSVEPWGEYPLFPDIDLYRYVLKHNYRKYSLTDLTDSWEFYIYDRKEKKELPCFKTWWL